jgi:hypothetical protein
MSDWLPDIADLRERFGRQVFIWERRPPKISARNFEITRKVIKEGRTLREVAAEYEVSGPRVRQVCQRVGRDLIRGGY